MPSSHYAVIDSQYDAVRDGDVEALREELLGAVRRAGAFVRVGEPSRPVDVLFTASTPVHMEHRISDDDGGGAGSPFLEPEYLDDHLEWVLGWR